MFKKYFGFFPTFTLLLIFSCQTTPTDTPPPITANNTDTLPFVPVDIFTVNKIDKKIATIHPIDYDTTKWTELIRLDENFILNLKYATEDNFVDRQLYDCPRCFLHPEAESLWDIMPNPSYVTPPKKGSMHNRGLAVDLTIAHLNGDTLEMGTPFDYFGARGHHTYRHHTPTVQANRALLKSTMAKYGFSSIRTEWWHYNFRGVRRKTSDMQWACDE